MNIHLEAVAAYARKKYDHPEKKWETREFLSPAPATATSFDDMLARVVVQRHFVDIVDDARKKEMSSPHAMLRAARQRSKT